jgi:DNA-binding NarL/FixJ family response regulator
VNASPAKVFLVDDHPLVREWLTNLVNQLPDLSVCGEAPSVEAAIEGIAVSKPAIAIVDLSLKESSGIDLIKTIKARFPDTGVIVLSMHDEQYYAERTMRAGARGYVMKGEVTSDILAAIREVMAGRIYLSPRMRKIFSERFVDGHMPSLRSPVETLSDRELEVFQLLGQGIETRRVAQRLNVSIKTVQAYCARIKEKLQLANASELLREAVRWNDSQVPG